MRLLLLLNCTLCVLNDVRDFNTLLPIPWLAPQPDISVLILVFNACVGCPTIPALFPFHIHRHYHYLRDMLPDLVPQLQVRNGWSHYQCGMDSFGTYCLVHMWVCVWREKEGYSWFGTGSFLHVLLLMKKWVESLPLAYCYVRMCMCVEGERGLIICKSLYWQTSERTRGGILSVFHLVQGSLFWQQEVSAPIGPSSVVAKLGLCTLKIPPLVHFRRRNESLFY